MKILSIETSCDETAISIIESELVDNKPVFKILGNALYSQADTHADFGGVFPALAKREHSKNFTPILISALKEAGLLVEIEEKNQTLQSTDEKQNSTNGTHSSMNGAQSSTNTTVPNATTNLIDSLSFLNEREKDLHDQLLDFFQKYEVPKIDAVAVTTGPGLEPTLWVGINGAKALAYIWQLPIIPVNHMEGHITSVLIDEKSGVNFPAVALLISGGHTELVQVNSWGNYKLLGQTRDDAVGEAFDKAARIIGLKYPGGPKISALAKRWREDKFSASSGVNGNAMQSLVKSWTLPRPMIQNKDCDFSFSGLKTSVLYAVRDATQSGAQELSEGDKASLCAEFEQAVTDVLISKTKRATEIAGAKTLIIGGGVSANTYIRESFAKMISEDYTYENKDQSVTLLIPQHHLSTDNSIMIGVAGFLQYTDGHFIKNIEKKHLSWDQTDYPELTANGNLAL